jgi:hypothetical protein
MKIQDLSHVIQRRTFAGFRHDFIGRIFWPRGYYSVPMNAVRGVVILSSGHMAAEMPERPVSGSLIQRVKGVS